MDRPEYVYSTFNWFQIELFDNVLKKVYEVYALRKMSIGKPLIKPHKLKKTLVCQTQGTSGTKYSRNFWLQKSINNFSRLAFASSAQ